MEVCIIGNKLTYEYVKTIIEVEGYTLLSTEYINNNTKLDVKCPIGHTYSVKYSKFQSGRRCPYCSNKVKITRQDVETHLKLEDYELLSDFINSNEIITVKCPNNHEWNVTYQRFKKGARCSKCSNKYVEKKQRVNWTTDLVKEELIKYGFELLSEYKNAKTHIKIKCNKGHITNKLFSHFLKGHHCKYCSINLTNEVMRIKAGKELRDLAKEKGLIPLENYVNYHTPILLACKNGHFSYRSLANFKKGKGCKGCMMSPYEAMVYSLLKELKLNVIHEYVHPNLKDKRFDFAVVKDNFKDVVLLIEVDGEQHYKDNAFGNPDSLEWNIRRDNEKDEFCSTSNINLLRIPYFKMDNRNWILNEIKRFII